jgi:hypothetical protein
MGQCISHKQCISKVCDYYGAGILFTNGKAVLGGISNIDGSSIISGIGGKKENNENFYECAVRETIEEIFEIDVSSDFIKSFILDSNTFIIDHEIINDGYIIIVCNFAMLENLSKRLSCDGYKSDLFEGEMPNSYEDIIRQRKRSDNSEIKSLLLLPIENNNDELSCLNISKEFLDDINMYNNIRKDTFRKDT